MVGKVIPRITSPDVYRERPELLYGRDGWRVRVLGGYWLGFGVSFPELVVVVALYGFVGVGKF